MDSLRAVEEVEEVEVAVEMAVEVDAEAAVVVAAATLSARGRSSEPWIVTDSRARSLGDCCCMGDEWTGGGGNGGRALSVDSWFVGGRGLQINSDGRSPRLAGGGRYMGCDFLGAFASS